MGGSLRRSKRFRPKLTIKKKRHPLRKSKVAHDITQGRVDDIQTKLGVRPSWQKEKGYSENYKEAGLLSDINAGFGRNLKTDALQAESDARDSDGQDAVLDEDFAAAMGQQRPSGPAPPPRLTSHQRQIMQRLVTAHGEDVEAMRRDTKLNSMLLPASKLQKMLQSYKTHGRGAGVDFRTPKLGHRSKPRR